MTAAARHQSFLTRWGAQRRLSDSLLASNYSGVWRLWYESEPDRVGAPFAHADGSDRIYLDEVGIYLVKALLPAWMRVRRLDESGVLNMRWVVQIDALMPTQSRPLGIREQQVQLDGKPAVAPTATQPIPWWTMEFAGADALFTIVTVAEEDLPDAAFRAAGYCDVQANGASPSFEQRRRLLLHFGSNWPMYYDGATFAAYSGSITEQTALDATGYADNEHPTWGGGSAIDICKISDEPIHRALFEGGGG